MMNSTAAMPAVALITDNRIKQYPCNVPFSPHQRYPEYPFDHVSHEANPVYESIRQMFVSLGYDKENFGKRSWNPLKHFVSHGQVVVIKPNWVFHRNIRGDSFTGLVTHSSVIRVIIDYLVIALEQTGIIIIGDAPIQSSDFSKILQKSQINSVVSFIKDSTQTEIRIEDFRREITIRNDGVRNYIYHNDDTFIKVNLRQESYLSSISDKHKNFRVTGYDKDKMLSYHNRDDHIYVIHKSILNADAVISIPKLKSHRKAGLTCCLKNSIGINCQKDCLPHHRKYSTEEGGDAYRKASLLKRIKEELFERYDKTHSHISQRFYTICLRGINRLTKLLSIETDFEGSWYGNATLWRTILDINRILFYADEKGNMCEDQQRKLLYIVDGIVAGEREGPLEPTNRHLGLMAAGENPLAVDLAMSRLIGFDYKKIPSLLQAVNNSFLWESDLDPDDIPVKFGLEEVCLLKDLNMNLHLEPSSGWRGYIERTSG